MDMYEAIMAENRQLEKATKRLVDTTANDEPLRKELLDEISARFHAVESAREEFIYPELRAGIEHPGIGDDYHRRAFDIRLSIDQLHRIPGDSQDDFQRQAELLLKEVTDFVQWEIHEAHPVLRKIIDGETAAEVGDRIRAMEKRVFHEKLRGS